MKEAGFTRKQASIAFKSCVVRSCPSRQAVARSRWCWIAADQSLLQLQTRALKMNDAARLHFQRRVDIFFTQVQFVCIDEPDVVR